MLVELNHRNCYKSKALKKSIERHSKLEKIV